MSPASFADSDSGSKTSPMEKTFYIIFGKRWFDAACSLGGLILLSPLFLAVAIAIKCSSRGPVFFRQVRLGEFARPFRIWKFRTMVDNADREGPLITADGDSRITAVGRWLRRSKIDELPQLLNVLGGEMSLVGPRPEVPMYSNAYTGAYRRILFAKPGITGPAANHFVREEELLASQPDKANFYITAILPRKLELDFKYCEEIRFMRDVNWIRLTVATLFEQSFALRSTFQKES
jgi:lipopolysaccharide/colanic/teichoic acid biosynthesis glycosyltransferase